MSRKIRNRILSVFLVFAILVLNIISVPKVNAAQTRDVISMEELPVVYIEYTAENVREDYTVAKAIELCSNKKAPLYKTFNDTNEEIDFIGKPVENYFFGGWFKEVPNSELSPEAYRAEDRRLSIKSVDEMNGLTTIYAKFVPAYVLSMKGQNSTEWTDTKGTADTKDDINRTTMRIISSVDSLEYYEVGYQVYVNNRDSQSVFTYTTFVYDELKAEGKTYSPTQVFGSASKYFMTWNYTNIPANGYGVTIYVQPYWITWDGTKVIGLAKNLHVIDGREGYINIPINFTNAEKMAAGHVSLDYTYIANDYELLSVENDNVNGVEKGRVFHQYNSENKTGYGELDYEVSENARGSKLLNIVINNDDVTWDSDGKDLFACVRFKKKEGGNEITIGENNLITFEIKNESIANAAEEVNNYYSVWPILY